MVLPDTGNAGGVRLAAGGTAATSDAPDVVADDAPRLNIETPKLSEPFRWPGAASTN